MSLAIKPYYKKDLAKKYQITTRMLRDWLVKAPGVWDIIDYNSYYIIPIDKVRIIVAHLGEP